MAKSSSSGTMLEATHTGPQCLVKGCEQRTLIGERLCAIHYYKLPVRTRSLLALQDGERDERERRVISYIAGGQPPEHVHL